MDNGAITYGRLDESLRRWGFTVHTQKGKARIYRHEPTGASIYLPDTPFDDEVLPRHLVAVRHVLSEYELGDPRSAS